MSKVAAYLQEHILGEVSTNPAILGAMSHDASVLEIIPEMVVYPRVTNDIRKIARFAWQLAEKGHVLSLTARGYGGDETGGAIGKGVVISFPAHMNRIFEFDAKQKLIRVQPGVSAKSLSDALALQGMGVPPLVGAMQTSIGGAVANNMAGPLSGKYGDTRTWVHQLEVALASGDLLQTGRISKRELNKRKGMQTFEGEIYRNLDSLIEDNKQLIDEKLTADMRDNAGYNSLAKVKQKDGSFDLTPLFVGSQGTLGIISEMIMKCEFMSAHTAVAVAAFTSTEAARDALDQLVATAPALLEYYDGELFKLAAAQGRKYDIYREVGDVPSAVVVVGFDDFNERHRARQLKKVYKMLSKMEAVVEVADGEDAASLLAVREVTAFSTVPAGEGESAPPFVNGVYVPQERFEEFSRAAATLAAKHHVAMPLHSRVLEGIVFARPALQMRKVGDKQKIFKLLDEYSDLVEQFGGHLIADGGEGRVKARFAYKHLDKDVLELFASVKAIFDPNGILNPGVKQAVEVRQLVSQLRADYDTAKMADFVSYNLSQDMKIGRTCAPLARGAGSSDSCMRLVLVSAA